MRIMIAVGDDVRRLELEGLLTRQGIFPSFWE